MTLTDAEWGLVHSHVGHQAHKTERAELRALPRMLAGVKHFVDVGASYGPFTWVANYALRDVEITAVEANPSLCSHLKSVAKACTEGQSGRGNTIRVLNHAISNTNGTVDFLINNADYSTSRIQSASLSEAASECTQTVTVPVRTLDSLFGNTPPDLVKLDVEGFEWRAIDGARHILLTRKTRFLVEIHPWGDPELSKTPRDVFKIFRTHGYDVTRINHHWLFAPGASGLTSRLKSHFYAFCTETPWVRTVARRWLSLGR
jgi:FkbM family methyltransferase